MGIKTTPFRRIALYVVSHCECRNEIGMPVHIDEDTTIKSMCIYPNDMAEVIIVKDRQLTKLTCKLKE